MSEERVLKKLWETKNISLSLYRRGDNLGREWSWYWLDDKRLHIVLRALQIVYRKPAVRVPRDSPMFSTTGCVDSAIGAAAVVALGLFLLYLWGVSWQIVAGLAASAVIFGLCLAITIAILDWRVE